MLCLIQFGLNFTDYCTGTHAIMKPLPIALFSCLAFIYSSAQDTHLGQIAPELVGKWCFINPFNGSNATQTGSCITLNDDGTYEFYLDASGMTKANSFFPGTALQERDSGTWWSQGNTIYYHSSAHGEGSFQFQKVNQPQNESTPMIVVNGQSFASAIAHDPW